MAEKKDKKTESKPKKLKKGEYIEGVGRRKRSVARVRIFASAGQDSVEKSGFKVNKKTGEEYFSRQGYRDTALEPLSKLKMADQFSMTVWVRGGGITGQAEAVRLGLARALEQYDPLLRPRLKKEGYLTRDPRETERKKPGLKKARKAPQFSKR